MILPRVCVAAAAAVAVCKFWQPAFVPAHHRLPVVPLSAAAASTAAILGASTAAHADAVDDAAVKWADTIYPLMKKVDWFENKEVKEFMATYANEVVPLKIAIAMQKICKSGMSMDPALVKLSVKTHSQALGNAGSIFGKLASQNKLICPLQDFEDISKSIAHMFASADINGLREVYDSCKDLPSIASLNKAFYMLDPVVAKNSYKAFLLMGEAVGKARDIPAVVNM